jgi:putative flippase GtrA
MPIKKFTKYIVVGGIGAVIQLGGTYILTEKVHLYYMFSLAISIVLATSFGFTANYLWTFRK